MLVAVVALVVVVSWVILFALVVLVTLVVVVALAVLCRVQNNSRPIIAYFQVHVNIFGPFSDYLIGHPSALQTTTNVD